MNGDDEADRVEGTTHPRHATALIGHVDRERDLLDAYRSGRLPHAIILGGQAGIGKATLAWRLARFILTYPLPEVPAVRDAVDLSVLATSKAAAQLASLSHPDVSLLRREANEKTKRFYTEIRADDVRRTIGLFQRAAGAGGWRVCIVDSADDLNRSSANALLKLIEEPPPKSLFILVAHRPGLILPTIRSRARVMRLDSLTSAQVRGVVQTLGSPWTEASDGDLAAPPIKPRVRCTMRCACWPTTASSWTPWSAVFSDAFRRWIGARFTSWPTRSSAATAKWRSRRR